MEDFSAMTDEELLRRTRGGVFGALAEYCRRLRGCSDEELMRRFQGGNTFAFEVLYERWYPRVLRWMQGDEDAAQEVFVRLWHSNVLE